MRAKHFVIRSRRLRRRFRDIVEGLWRRKALRLLAFVERPRGPQPKFTRRWRERKLDALQDLVLEAYLPRLRKWVSRGTTRVQVRFLKNDPRSDRARAVKDGLVKRGWNRKHLVYASFRSDGKCLKVGMSNKGLGRIAQQGKQVSFWNAARVVVYFPHRRKKKVLPALECALTHIFDPMHTDVWPAQPKYLDKCPACKDSERVRSIIRDLFPA